MRDFPYYANAVRAESGQCWRMVSRPAGYRVDTPRTGLSGRGGSDGQWWARGCLRRQGQVLHQALLRDFGHGLGDEPLERRCIERPDVAEHHQGDVVALPDHDEAFVDVQPLDRQVGVVGGALVAVSKWSPIFPAVSPAE